MKFKTNFENAKPVDYFGLTVYIPEKCKFLATDADGELWAYTERPQKHSNGYWSQDSRISEYICKLDLETMHWTETLRKVK
jgi:hypothetical protein